MTLWLTTTHSVADSISKFVYWDRSLARMKADLTAGENEYVIGASSEFSLRGAPSNFDWSFSAFTVGDKIVTSKIAVSKKGNLQNFELALEDNDTLFAPICYNLAC